MSEKILFVDDEPRILQSIKRNLRKQYTLSTAESGCQALALLESEGPFAVIVADMQMPEMNGAELLMQAKKAAPETVRMMLTGNADQQTAIDAVNKGDILRFLNKPSSPEDIAHALDAGLQQHRLITAEKELLEKTLRGSVQALAEVMALSNPEVFGRSTRISERVLTLAKALGIEQHWELESAALLSLVGCVSLPKELVQRSLVGGQMSDAEREEFASHAAAGAELLANIPRMEQIAEIIRYQEAYFDGSGWPANELTGQDLPLGARILRAILDLDGYESAGESTDRAIDRLSEQACRYDPNVLAALVDLAAADLRQERGVVALSELAEDMKLAVDLRTTTGTLLVAMGQHTTASVQKHLLKYHRNGLIGDTVEVWQSVT